MKALTWLSGSAPMKPSSGWPFLKAMTAGIDWMPSWPAICGCSSMFILTSRTLPRAFRTAFSSTGVSCRHGPHQGAQKSTRTGTVRDASSTSARKLCVVVSLMRSPAADGAGCFSPLPRMRVSALMVAPFGFRLIWRSRGRFPSLSARGSGAGNRQDPRRVAGRLEKGQEVVAADRRRCAVVERMEIQPLMAHERLVENDGDAAGRVVDHAEWRHGAGDHPEEIDEQIRPAERQAGAADADGQHT